MGQQSDESWREISLHVMRAVLVALMTTIFVSIGVLLIRSETQKKEASRHEQIAEALHNARESLANRIYMNIYKISAVNSIVAMNPNLTQADFARAIEVQFRGDNDLRNIAVARGMVIHYMYPMEGNEAAIGLDYSTVPEQYEAVLRAIELNEIVLAGPVALVQGGEGIIARSPIFVKDPVTGEDVLWGLSSSVLRVQNLLGALGVQPDHGDLRFALRGKDALGASGDVFWGDPSVFERSPLIQTIELPHGSWQIGVVPVHGWGSNPVLFTPLLTTYYLVALAILGFMIVIIRLSEARQTTLKALQAAEARLAQTAYELTENIPVGTYTMVQPPEGGPTRFNFMSRRFLEISGLTREKAADPSRAFEDIHPEDRDAWIARNVASFTEKAPFQGETRVVVNGTVRWVRAESNPRSLPDGTTVWEGVLTDITEENMLKEQLIREKERAEAANIAKSQFLANMSHEIRTPLNGLIGFTELLKHTELTSEQQQYVHNANISGHLLLNVISDILDFSKIEAGKLDLQPEKTDIRLLLENSLEIVRVLADQKGLTLRVNVADNTPRYAYVDPVRLNQILANLLGNAVKFTEKGEVTLQLDVQPFDGDETTVDSLVNSDADRAKLCFSVQDTGIGIGDVQREKLFSAFSQADNSITRKFGGTGLGLAISEMLANRMGSKIDFISRPGVGTTFFFDLITQVEFDDTSSGPINPLQMDNASIEDAKIPEKPTLEVTSNGQPPGGLRSPLAPVYADETFRGTRKGPTSESADTSPLRILIVEDVSINMMLLKFMLRDMCPNAEVFEATDGGQAVELYTLTNPDIIFMDIQMPVLDGISATEQIRRMEAATGSHIPIIALTAGVLKEEKDKCFAAGLDAFLTKPLESDAIRQVLTRYQFISLG